MYRILIDNEYLDIEEDAGLILTANDPLDYRFGRAYKTYSIIILNTGNNNLILDNLFYKNYDRTLTFDGVLIIGSFRFEGKLFINSVNEDHATGQFVSAVGLLWSDILSKNLKEDFDWSTYDHTLTVANIDASDAGTLSSGDIRYDFCYRGDGLLPVRYTYDIMYDTDITERMPAVRFRRILEKIFDGYTIYQNVMTEAQFDRLYILYCQKQTRHEDGWMTSAEAIATREEVLAKTDYSMSIGANENTLAVTMLFDQNTANMDTDGRKYVITESGAYRFSGKITLDDCTFQTTLTETIDWKERRFRLTLKEYNDSDVLQGTIFTHDVDLADEQTTAVDQSWVDFDVDLEFDTKTREMTKDHYVVLEIVYRNVAYDGVDIYNNAPQTVPKIEHEVGADFLVQPWLKIGWNGTVDGEWIMPDMTVSDLIRGLLVIFNLEVYFSYEKKEVRFYNRFIASPAILDISDLIIAGSLSTVDDWMEHRYELIYKNDSGDQYAQERFAMGDDNGNYEEVNGSKEAKIISTNYSFNAIRVRSPAIIQMTNLYVNEYTAEYRAGEVKRPSFTTNFNPRLAFYDGDLSYTYRLHASTATGAEVLARTEVPKFRNVYDGVSLSFKDLYDTHHKENIDRIESGKTIECEMIIDDAFLSNLYYLQSPDMRDNFYISISGFDGVYQLIEAEMLRDNIYSAKLAEIL